MRFKFTKSNKNVRRAMYLGALVLGSMFTATSAAEAKTYYVSKNGSNADGLTWQTAWNEMNQIQWNQLSNGDQLAIDGGATSMIYTTSLIVPSLPNNLSISRSVDAGHNGIVYIQPGYVAQNTTQNVYPFNPKGPLPAIYVTGGSTLSITGGKWNGIIARDAAVGIYVNQSYNNNLTLSGLSVGGCGLNTKSVAAVDGGVYICSNGVTMSNLIVHDNAINLVCTNATQLSRSWVYNYTPANLRLGIGAGPAIGALGATGLFCDVNGYGPMSVSQCVFGPGLSTGLQAQSALTVSNCLMLDCLQGNLFGKVTGNSITSFETGGPTALGSMSPACITGSEQLSNSIFYGGAVNVQGFSGPNGNTQFDTTGNTMFLASGEVNPLFVTNVSGYQPDVSFTTLQETNFALQPSSPAKGTGSAVTSVAYLISKLAPQAPTGP